MSKGPEEKIVQEIRDGIEALKRQGLPVDCWRFHQDGRNTKGFPDLVACVQGKMLGIEVKAPGKEPTMNQIEEGRRMMRAGGEWLVAKSFYPVRKAINRLLQDG